MKFRLRILELYPQGYGIIYLFLKIYHVVNDKGF